MAVVSKGRSTGSGSASGLGLRLLAVWLGVYFVAMGMSKVAWLTNDQLLLDRFVRWESTARPEVRWYLETVAMPGAPLFARLVPLGEFATGLALLVGAWPRLAAAVALFMVVNFHFASGDYSSWQFFRDGNGPPVIGGLLALALTATKLPWSLRG